MSTIRFVSVSQFLLAVHRFELINTLSTCSPDEHQHIYFLQCVKHSIITNIFTGVWQNRRTTHISAEQKRRCNINIGFKTLGNLVPTLKSQSNVSLFIHVLLLELHSTCFVTLCLQITNAVTLQKTVEHIGKLQQERQQIQEEVKRLREEIEELNASIR